MKPSLVAEQIESTQMILAEESRARIRAVIQERYTPPA